MQPVGTLKKIKTAEKGIYYQLDTGKVIFISHGDLAFDFQMKAFRSKFEDDWPLLWMLRKMDIPMGPVEFSNTPRTREGRLVEDYGDLYFLTQADLLRCGIGDPTSDKILTAIDNSKTRPLGKIIFALGILNVGREWGEKLAKKFGSIDALGRATWKDLILTPGLGVSLASSILGWFHTEGNWKSVEKMRIAGVQLSSSTPDKPVVLAESLGPHISNPEDYYRATKEWIAENDEQISSLRYDVLQIWLDRMKVETSSATKVPVVASAISGKTFMFTGRLETMTRAQAQAKVVEADGLVGSGVSKNTDYLVVGDKPGSKLGHASALGIKRITEQEFYSLLNKEASN